MTHYHGNPDSPDTYMARLGQKIMIPQIETSFEIE